MSRLLEERLLAENVEVGGGKELVYISLLASSAVPESPLHRVIDLSSNQ
jgi:hypothetical protein